MPSNSWPFESGIRRIAVRPATCDASIIALMVFSLPGSPARKVRLHPATVVFVLMLAFCNGAQGQSIDDFLHDVPTQERIQQPGWWPTKPLLPKQQKELVGWQTCAKCHGSIASSQRQTGMAHALMTAGSSTVLEQHAHDSFRLGSFQYSIDANRENNELSVSDGSRTLSTRLQWAFGSGEVGQSYSWEQAGTLYESRFNYFDSTHGFDYTPGRTMADSFPTALGRPLSDAEGHTCFACHSTGLTSAKPLSLDGVVLGVTCEACHGPGAKHVAAATAGERASASHILNPGKLSPSESVNFCGACHSTTWDVKLAGFAGVDTVRFPVYRLQQSRCWGNGDARITCAACHDPHQPLVHDAAFYDKKCLRCHQSSPHTTQSANHLAAACPVASSQCTTCHMPKYELPSMHYKFTDHRIRVARKDAPFPE